MNPWDIGLVVYIFAIGICFGSFLNVCIYRIPEELSVIKPRSRCPKCGYNITWFDNIPLLSWLMLGGKCRQCKVGISPRYFLVELLTGILFVFVWLKYPIWTVDQGYHDLRALGYGLMVFGLILGTFVDIDHMILPDRTTIGGMVTGVFLSFFIPQMHGQIDHTAAVIKSLSGMAFGFGILYAVSVIGRLVLKKDAMGFGDVKLMGALGAYLGIPAVLFIIFISSLLGTIVGVTFIAMGKHEWQAKIPFGPYIAAAAVIWVLGGSAWWSMYMEWLNAGTGY